LVCVFWPLLAKLGTRSKSGAIQLYQITALNGHIFKKCKCTNVAHEVVTCASEKLTLRKVLT